MTFLPIRVIQIVLFFRLMGYAPRFKGIERVICSTFHQLGEFEVGVTLPRITVAITLLQSVISVPVCYATKLL